MSKIEEGLQGVPCVVPAKPLNLLLPTMVRAYHEALLQVALRSVLGKGAALLTDILLHVGIVLLLQIAHLAVTAMVEKIFRGGTAIDIQATDVFLTCHLVDVTKVHQEARVLPGIGPEEVEVRVSPIVQGIIVAATGNVAVAGVLFAAQVLQRSDHQ